MRGFKLAAAIAFLAACGAATPDPASTVPAGPPFIYDVTGPGRMHIVGRVWVACEEDMPDAALASVKSSGTFVSPILSSDDGGRFAYAEANIMMSIAFLPVDHSLHEWLSDDEVQKAKERAPGRPGVGTSMRRTEPDVSEMRPGAVVRALIRSHRCRSKDIYREAAADAKKKFIGLMPADALYTLVDDARDARVLKALLVDRDNPDRERARLLAALRAGDETVFQGEVAEPPLQSRLPDRRAEWTARLDELARQGETFVELPVSELVGPTGILAGLEKLGYTVTRRR